VTEGSRIYLDANIFIYALEGGDDVGSASRALLFALSERPGRAMTSELTLAEVLVRPERERDLDLKRRYMDLLLWRRFIELRPVSRSVLLESARYRAVAKGSASPSPESGELKPDRRNFLADAIHVVTAIDGRCEIFVARDRRIQLPQGMRRVQPDRHGISELVESLR
jgi:predicted nucleic acid-binding protein